MKINRFFSRSTCLCLVCGVDSKFLIFFFVATLGAAVLGSVFIFAWSVLSGHWAQSEKPKYKILEVESDGDDKPS